MNIAATIELKFGGPGSGRHPEGVHVSRAKDFRTSGEYDVKVGDKNFKMYRDPENGMWYEAGTGKHFSLTFLGVSKEDALNRLSTRK